jgi:cell division protein ZapE
MLINYLNKEITLDEHQKAVYFKLSKLANFLEQNYSNDKNKSWLKNLFPKRSAIKIFSSLYIYGDVGRGKSMLMKIFYDHLKINHKIYFHFNSFMKKIHETLRDLRKEAKKYDDELIEAVKRIIKNNHLLCLDEFQVLDIADATLLERIFSYLFKKNVTVIFTSNSYPLELYKDGLQRELFLKFVRQILLKECEVINLDSAIDYRSLIADNNFDFSVFEIAELDKKMAENPKLLLQIKLTKLLKTFDKTYLIKSEKNYSKIKTIINIITENKSLKAKKIKLWGREIKIDQSCNNIAILNFADLCSVDFGISDYQAICQNFDLLFLLEIPKLTLENSNEIKRFIWLIDEIYENQLALIMVAAVEINDLCPSNYKDTSFKRMISRIREITSNNYFYKTKLFN